MNWSSSTTQSRTEDTSDPPSQGVNAVPWTIHRQPNSAKHQITEIVPRLLEIILDRTTPTNDLPPTEVRNFLRDGNSINPEVNRIR